MVIIPDTVPEVDGCAVSGASTREISALVVVLPSQLVRPDVVVPHLVRVSTTASLDLQVIAVGSVSALNIEALVTVNLECTVLECPLLGLSASAALEGDSSTVRVGCSGHALGVVKDGLKQELALEPGNSRIIVILLSQNTLHSQSANKRSDHNFVDQRSLGRGLHVYLGG